MRARGGSPGWLAAQALLLACLLGPASPADVRRSHAAPAPPAMSPLETSAARPDAPLLLSGGRILAGIDRGRNGLEARWVDALLLDGGRVAVAGTLGQAEGESRRRHLEPRRVDLAGAFAMPGLCDAHVHLAGLGFALARLRLQGTRSADEIVAMVAAEAVRRPRGAWILGRGWDQNDWANPAFPTHEALDRVAPDHPVWLRRVDGHAGWANARALALAGITRATADPPGGRIHREPDGSPGGVLVDNAMDLMDRVVPEPTAGETEAALVRAGEHIARLGLAAVHDAGIDSTEVEVYRRLAGGGALPVRVFAMLSAATAMRPDMLPQPKVSAGDGLFRVFAVKAYADGALGSRGAALLAPYSDEPGSSGLLVTTPDTLELIARLCLEHGYPMATHAIGDRGNRVALDAYARAAGGAMGLRGRRFRIEHAQVLSDEDLPRFADLGVIASMQPTHCTSDMPWAPARLGSGRIAGAYAWRRLLDSGARLALGSDFPVEDPDPRLGLYAAVTTQDTTGNPPQGFRPSERLTILEALRGFTSDAAYAAFAEDEVGRLEPGMRADLTVFDRDLTKVPPHDILAARCLMTVVAGRVRWESPDLGRGGPAPRR